VESKKAIGQILNGKYHGRTGRMRLYGARSLGHTSVPGDDKWRKHEKAKGLSLCCVRWKWALGGEGQGEGLNEGLESGGNPEFLPGTTKKKWRCEERCGHGGRSRTNGWGKGGNNRKGNGEKGQACVRHGNQLQRGGEKTPVGKTDAATSLGTGGKRTRGER